MSQAVRFQAQVELAEKVKVDGPRVRFPHYGRYLEEFGYIQRYGIFPKLQVFFKSMQIF